MTDDRQPRLIELLPPLRGRLLAFEPMASHTWFRVGGPAEVLFKPADVDDLATFLSQRPKSVPYTVIGAGSNLLVRDGGIPGVVIRLGGAFAGIEILDDRRVRVGAGALDQTLVETARANAIGGFEFLSGIPGTVGGALRMNAGAFGGEMKDVTIEVRAIDGDGNPHVLGRDDMGYSYRRSSVPEDWIFLDAVLQGRDAEPEAIARMMQDIRTAREETQPIHGRTGGSTFANPKGARAWELIEKARCRGLVVGGAAVSDKHCNFLLNANNASAADIETLGEEIRRRVHDATGYELTWEIRRIGVFADNNQAVGDKKI